MVLAVVVMAAVRALTGQPVTLLIFAAVLAMISNLAVNEPDLSRRRATTAAHDPSGGRRGHRRDAARAAPPRRGRRVRRRDHGGGVRPPVRSARLRAGHGRVHAVLLHPVPPGPSGGAAVAAGRGRRPGWVRRCSCAGTCSPSGTTGRWPGCCAPSAHTSTASSSRPPALLAAAGGPADRVESALQDTRRRRTRLNRTALLVADRLDRLAPEGSGAEDPTGRTRTGPGSGCWTSSWPPSGWPSPRAGSRRSAVRTAVTATSSWTACARSPRRRRPGHRTRWCPRCWTSRAGAVVALTEETAGKRERTQRVAFAVHRLANALGGRRAAVRRGGVDGERIPTAGRPPPTIPPLDPEASAPDVRREATTPSRRLRCA